MPVENLDANFFIVGTSLKEETLFSNYSRKQKRDGKEVMAVLQQNKSWQNNFCNISKRKESFFALFFLTVEMGKEFESINRCPDFFVAFCYQVHIEYTDKYIFVFVGQLVRVVQCGG